MMPTVVELRDAIIAWKYFRGAYSLLFHHMLMHVHCFLSVCKVNELHAVSARHTFRLTMLSSKSLFIIVFTNMLYGFMLNFPEYRIYPESRSSC